MRIVGCPNKARIWIVTYFKAKKNERVDAVAGVGLLSELMVLVWNAKNWYYAEEVELKKRAKS